MPSRMHTVVRPSFAIRATFLSCAQLLGRGSGPARVRRARNDQAAVDGVFLSALVVVFGLGLTACGGAGNDSSARSGKSRATATATTVNTDVDRAVDIGGRSLWLTCTGTGSPTVVLVHGQGQDMSSLAIVHAGAYKLTRTCSYDRAGQGRSDPGPQPQTIQHIVKDLFALLHAADIEPPYVLVGHSLGGPIVWGASTEHPDEVAGFLSMNGVPRAADWLPRILPRFTRSEQREERAYYRGDNDEQVQLIASDARLRAGKPPDDMPYIIMHGTDCKGDDFCNRTQDIALRLDRGLARVSRGGRLVIVRAGHEIYLDMPSVVTTAISDLLKASAP